MTKFESFNVGNSAELTGVVSQLQELVGGVDPRTIKTDRHIREDIEEHVTRAQGLIDNMIVRRNAREIVFQDDE
jgi:hypothetical protein